jgi:hypothetical protein
MEQLHLNHIILGVLCILLEYTTLLLTNYTKFSVGTQAAVMPTYGVSYYGASAMYPAGYGMPAGYDMQSAAYYGAMATQQGYVQAQTSAQDNNQDSNNSMFRNRTLEFIIPLSFIVEILYN